MFLLDLTITEFICLLKYINDWQSKTHHKIENLVDFAGGESKRISTDFQLNPKTTVTNLELVVLEVSRAEFQGIAKKIFFYLTQ